MGFPEVNNGCPLVSLRLRHIILVVHFHLSDDYGMNGNFDIYSCHWYTFNLSGNPYNYCIDIIRKRGRGMFHVEVLISKLLLYWFLKRALELTRRIRKWAIFLTWKEYVSSFFHEKCWVPQGSCGRRWKISQGMFISLIL